MRYLTLCFATALATFSLPVIAEVSNHEVTPQQYITQEELAAIYVLSEICPSLLEQSAHFQQGYQQLLQEYLPNIANPVEALNDLSRTQEFAPILLEAKQDADNAGVAKNTQICQEMTTYRK